MRRARASRTSRWRCPATRWRSAGSPAPASPSAPSPTSRRTTSTSTPTWRTTSPRRPPCSRPAAPSTRWSASTTSGAPGWPARTPGAVTVAHGRPGRLVRPRRRRPPPTAPSTSPPPPRTGRCRCGCACRAPFNVANALVALACLDAVGVPPEVAAAGVAQVAVPGRMQRVERGPAVPRGRRLRPQAGRRRRAARRPARAGRRPADRRARRRRRPRPGQAPADGRRRGRPGRRCWSSPTTTRAPRIPPPSAPRCWPARRGEPRRGEVREIGDRAAAIAAAVAAARPGDAVVVAGQGPRDRAEGRRRHAPLRRRRGACCRDRAPSPTPPAERPSVGTANPGRVPG